jgi:hypothetical protein
MPSTAAQLLRSPRRRHRLPRPQTPQPERGCPVQPAVAAVVAVEDVRTPATPFVALSASAVRHADGRPSKLVGRTSGVHASGVHASGVIRVSGRTRVRSPRPVRPRCPHRAGSRNAFGAAGQATCGTPGSTCRCSPRAAWSSLPESGLAARDGRTLAVCGSHEGRRQTWAAASHAHRLRRRARRLADQGSWSSARCRSVRGGAGKERVRSSPPQGRPGRVAGVMADHGAGPGGGDHARWSLRWCWFGVVRRWRAPSGSVGSRLRPQRGRSRWGALSARSCQRADQGEQWWARQGLNL